MSGGGKPKYTPSQLRKLILDYFEGLNGKMPCLAGLRKHLRVNYQTLNEWRRGRFDNGVEAREDRGILGWRDEFMEILDLDFDAPCEDSWVQLLKEPKQANGARTYLEAHWPDTYREKKDQGISPLLLNLGTILQNNIMVCEEKIKTLGEGHRKILIGDSSGSQS